MMFQRIKDSFIDIIDKTYPLGGRIDADGGAVIFDYITSSDNIFISSLSNFSSNIFSSHKIIEHILQRPGRSEHFTDLLLAAPEASKLITAEVATEIRNYLGYGARLDVVTMFAIKTAGKSSEQQNHSGLYHHDSVGHRLKFFFPLNLEGNQLAPTEYLLGSHRLRYKTFANAAADDGTRIDPALVSQYSNKSQHITVPFGKGFMFDTNGIHRGCYESASIVRLTIQFEFSAHKTGIVRGYIGPRRFDLHTDAAEWLVALGLLRKRCLKKMSDGTYRHSSIFDQINYESRLLDLICR
jgi:hypothetical protein